jgi:catechol 2,3-dioxygenase-like lactoylglutathione lyase family enzyme
LQSYFYAIEPELPVADVSLSLEWYQEFLGAERPWQWGEPVIHGGCHFGRLHVQFRAKPGPPRVPVAVTVCLTDLAGFRVDIEQRGLGNIPEIEVQPWGRDELIISDPDGHQLRFSSHHRDQLHKPPALVGIHVSAEANPEILTLYGTVGWPTPRHLSPAVAWATATVDDRLIGAACIRGTGPDAYIIQDVMVRPTFQGQRIGTKLILALHQWAHENLPDAVGFHLFTSPQTAIFYARLGYHGPESGQIGMRREI